MRGLVICAAVLWGCAAEPAMPGVTTAFDDDEGESGTTAMLTSSSSLATTTATTTTAASSSEDDGPPAPDLPHTVRFAEIAGIFSANCLFDCHTPSGEHPQLDLSSNPRGNLVFVASTQSSLFHVTAGDREASYLWHKLSGTQGTVGGSGSRMPEGERPLAQNLLDLVGEWIDDGAQP